VICESSVADKIAEHIMAQYTKNFSLSLYMSDVTVIRKEKF
jgi:hypothetical protein